MSALAYHDNSDRLQKMLRYMREDLQRYMLSDKAKPEYIIKQKRIIEVIEAYNESCKAIISERQSVIYYSSEDLKQERHMMYSNWMRQSRTDSDTRNNELWAENQALKRTIEKLRNAY